MLTWKEYYDEAPDLEGNDACKTQYPLEGATRTTPLDANRISKDVWDDLPKRLSMGTWYNLTKPLLS